MFPTNPELEKLRRKQATPQRNENENPWDPTQAPAWEILEQRLHVFKKRQIPNKESYDVPEEHRTKRTNTPNQQEERRARRKTHKIKPEKVTEAYKETKQAMLHPNKKQT